MKLTIQYNVQTCGEATNGADDAAIASFEAKLGDLLIPAVLAWRFCGGCDRHGFHRLDGELETDPTILALWRAYSDAEPVNCAWQALDGRVVKHWEVENIKSDPDYFYWPATASLSPTVVLAMPSQES